MFISLKINFNSYFSLLKTNILVFIFFKYLLFINSKLTKITTINNYKCCRIKLFNLLIFIFYISRYSNKLLNL